MASPRPRDRGRLLRLGRWGVLTIPRRRLVVLRSGLLARLVDGPPCCLGPYLTIIAVLVDGGRSASWIAGPVILTGWDVDAQMDAVQATGRRGVLVRTDAPAF